MIIVGIDPGSRALGYGVIEIQGKKFKYIDSGVFRYEKEKNFLNRLNMIQSHGQQLAMSYQPDFISVESLIYVKSVPSLAKLAQARGAILGAFGEKYIDKIFEYSPNQIKSSVSGFGHSSKEGIQKAVELILGVNKFKTHDESDALAVALCHALFMPNPRKSAGLRL